MDNEAPQISEIKSLEQMQEEILSFALEHAGMDHTTDDFQFWTLIADNVKDLPDGLDARLYQSYLHLMQFIIHNLPPQDSLLQTMKDVKKAIHALTNNQDGETLTVEKSFNEIYRRISRFVKKKIVLNDKILDELEPLFKLGLEVKECIEMLETRLKHFNSPEDYKFTSKNSEELKQLFESFTLKDIVESKQDDIDFLKRQFPLEALLSLLNANQQLWMLVAIQAIIIADGRIVGNEADELSKFYGHVSKNIEWDVFEGLVKDLKNKQISYVKNRALWKDLMNELITGKPLSLLDRAKLFEMFHFVARFSISDSHLDKREVEVIKCFGGIVGYEKTLTDKFVKWLQADKKPQGEVHKNVYEEIKHRAMIDPLMSQETQMFLELKKLHDTLS